MDHKKIAQLIHKVFFEDTATSAERAELKDWVLQNENNFAYLLGLLGKTNSGLSNTEKKRIQKKILHSFDNITHYRAIPWAAIIIGGICLLALIYLSLQFSNRSTDNVTKAISSSEYKYAPAGTYLIIGDQVLCLDSIHKGTTGQNLTWTGCQIQVDSNSIKFQNLSSKNCDISIKVGNGKIYSLLLPDSTKISLNNSSTLTFNSSYLQERSFSLNGEGYFEVQKGNRFIVKSSTSSVEALGTKFNVRSYLHDSSSFTTLIEGKVRVQAGAHSKIIGKPGRQVISDHQENMVEKEVDVSQVLFWQQETIIMQGMPLSEVLNEAGRHYNVTFLIEDNCSNGHFIGLGTKPDISLQDYLGIFEMMNLGLGFEINKDTITVYNKETGKSKRPK